jgi:hypothetical protein
MLLKLRSDSTAEDEDLPLTFETLLFGTSIETSGLILEAKEGAEPEKETEGAGAEQSVVAAGEACKAGGTMIVVLMSLASMINCLDFEVVFFTLNVTTK